MRVHQFDDLVSQFLAAEKTGHVRPRWRTVGHPEYAVAKIIVSAPNSRPNSRVLVGVLRLAAHKIRQPPKYSFALTFRGRRVLGLDVNPARNHRKPICNEVCGWNALAAMATYGRENR